MTYKCFIIIKYTCTHIIRHPCWNQVRGMFKRRRFWMGADSLWGSAKCQEIVSSLQKWPGLVPSRPSGVRVFLSRVGSDSRMPGFKSQPHHLPARYPGQESSPLWACFLIYNMELFLTCSGSICYFFQCLYPLLLATKLMPALQQNDKISVAYKNISLSCIRGIPLILGSPGTP